MSLSYLTITQIKQGLTSREFSCTELVKYYLKRIDDNKNLNAYITVATASALAQAQEVDRKIKNKEQPGALEGVPVAIKDIILTAGLKTTASSKALENYIAPYDAAIVKKLKAAGAVILGKTNCDEFAMGSSNETSAFGPVLNPWDKTRVPGGSSGGSAAAAAADLCCFSLGTDTGGSIRQPAAFCGVTGLKPTYGLVSRSGLVALTSSLDQAGPLTKTAEEAAEVLQIMAGPDAADATTYPEPPENYLEALKKDIKGLKVGLPKEYFTDGLSSEISKASKAAIKVLESLGAKFSEVSLPLTQFSLPVYYIVQPAEVSSNLARYDGIRYGHSSLGAKNLAEVYQQSREEGLGAEVKRRLMIGTYVLSSGYKEAYYQQARKVQKLIQRQYQEIFKEVDVLLTPTTPEPAFKLGAKAGDPLSMYLADIYTVAANIAGLCGLSIPAGFTKEQLPIGLQILGPAFGEAVILRLAHQYQQVTDHHLKHPKD